MAKAYLSGLSNRGVVVTEGQYYILFWEHGRHNLPQRATNVNIKAFLQEPITEMEADEYPFKKVYEKLHDLTVKASMENEKNEAQE